jgi:hypothetical protein
MKKLLLFICVGFAFMQCDDQIPSCSIPATIRDLTGLDGCGYVFELSDGTRLGPELIIRCGTPPYNDDARITNDNALLGFEPVDGMRVMISYEESESLSTCMVGPSVKITCIREISTGIEEH